MIPKSLLARALSIKKEYLSIVSNVDKYENIYKSIFESITKAKTESELLLKKIESGNDVNHKKSQSDLGGIVNKLEMEMLDVVKSIDNINASIENLSKSEIELYNEIKSVTNLEDSIIRDLVDKYLSENLD